MNKLPHKLDFKCSPNKKDIELPNYFYKTWDTFYCMRVISTYVK
jgi:hypothetical protein